jgi:hypothetical protein
MQKGLIWVKKERETKVEEKIKKSPNRQLRRKGNGRRRKGNNYSKEPNHSLERTRSELLVGAGDDQAIHANS